jgi:cation transport protein ChaC
MCTAAPTTKLTIPPPERPSILTRELLAAGGATILAGRDKPGVRLRSDVERKESLVEFMTSRPAGDLWIFAIGSLVWNPALRVAERRIAEVRGWHRSFCLSMAVGRGTPDEPGLGLRLNGSRR